MRPKDPDGKLAVCRSVSNSAGRLLCVIFGITLSSKLLGFGLLTSSQSIRIYDN